MARTSSLAESSWKCRTVASTSCWWSPTAAVEALVTRANGGASRGDTGDAIWQWGGSAPPVPQTFIFWPWKYLFTVAIIYLGTECLLLACTNMPT